MIKLNIGFLYLHPPGESMGSLYRVRKFCQGLTELGHKCFIFSPYSFSENWGSLVKFIQISVLKSKASTSKKIYKVIRWVLNLRFVSRYTILQSRFLNSIISSISRALLQKIKEESIQLDVIIGEQELGGLSLIKIKKNLEIPIIIDFHNYWPEELVENRVIKRGGKHYRYLVELEKRLINIGDLIITNGQYLREFLLKKFNEFGSSKIISIASGGIPFFNEPKEKKSPPKIIMAGIIEYRSNFKLFLESLPYVLKRYPTTQIFVTRKGEKLKEMMNLAKKMNININFFWKETYNEFLNFLAEFHVGIVTSTYDLPRKLGPATKILDYFSVGIPVVGNDIGGWTSLIREENVGLLSSNNSKDLADKILEIIENPEMAYEFGINAINLLKEKYNVKKFGKKLIKSIEAIL